MDIHKIGNCKQHIFSQCPLNAIIRSQGDRRHTTSLYAQSATGKLGIVNGRGLFTGEDSPVFGLIDFDGDIPNSSSYEISPDQRSFVNCPQERLILRSSQNAIFF